MKKYKTNQPCVVCGLSGEGKVCLHHVYTRKAYPEYANEPWNLMPLCFVHHSEIHQIGSNKFAQKYAKANNWFKNNNWEFRLSGKIFHDH